MHYRVEISPKSSAEDPAGAGVLHQIREFLHLPVDAVRTRHVFSLFLECPPASAKEIAAAFANPIIEEWTVGETLPGADVDWLIVVGFRPGVTDNVARSARSGIADILGRPFSPAEEVYTSTEYFVTGGELERNDVEHIACDLLANELIQTVAVFSREDVAGDGIPVNRPAVEDATPPEVQTVDLAVSDDELLRISREGILALSLEEMKAIQGYFSVGGDERCAEGLGSNPTDVELEVLAQTWSEHCKHKIFNARINYCDEEAGTSEVVDSCFKTFIKKSTDEIGETIDWLVSVFHDNAGVIRFNDEVDLVYKVETHNSPTALDPYGGSMTGIVGVNRDPMGTGKGANLLLNVWGYCFGSPFSELEDVPKGLFHPRRLRDQVHKGVIDGGNQSGIPYALGWEYFDRRYLGKPLVYCGTVGTLPRTIMGEPSAEKSIAPGDLAVMIGGRIGKDGIHGATFSSEELHKDSPVQAVQIGDPITQKVLYDFLMEARDQNLYRFVTDNGAGGLSSSIGEMAENCGGCDIDLGDAPLKYAGLQPWEILVSEAQERMSLAVPPEKMEAFLALAKRRSVEATVLGSFTDSGKFHVRFQGKTVAHLDMSFLHDGLPQMSVVATWRRPRHTEPCLDGVGDVGETLRGMLGRLNVCSGEKKARQYDHEVKGLSAIKPYVGVNNNVLGDATVSLIDPTSSEGIVLSCGIAPRYSDVDTYDMMASVIDMAIRRIIAVGGQLGHTAGLDNFCWPDPILSEKTPDGEYKAAQLVRANKALYDITKAFGAPCISGKDSMKNDSSLGGRKISIPPTVLFSAISRMPDVSKAVTLDAKRAGDLVYVLGTTYRELGGSELYAMLDSVGNDVPKLRVDDALELYGRVSTATGRELCHSLHSPAIGGLGVGLAKVAIGGHLGLDVDLDLIPHDDNLTPLELLFSESNSRFVATVPPHAQTAFEDLMNGVSCALVGKTILEPVVTLRSGATTVVETEVDDLLGAYTAPLGEL
ncbi:MAG: phosphoribosylformylglycinamidine synthase [Lentisphaerae bacterium]|nr:phosphoribosylformylglycinamidine synthase [Lentisphaerota bacterium]MBT5611295.1 phosphoribosylformylglycinamidine synthase [Lentisphaerota bacterium]MBT7058388.1 phosphoribosylformylglycinamidine synthase [Lentisphaerota bacterium]MBT7846823.1 phosphoribosylformylglycinamidine synthase [Lentisphaerota bacterium]